jgi:hypothetical protein
VDEYPLLPTLVILAQGKRDFNSESLFVSVKDFHRVAQESSDTVNHPAKLPDPWLVLIGTMKEWHAGYQPVASIGLLFFASANGLARVKRPVGEGP